MGVLKLSVIEERDKNSKSKMRVISLNGKPYHVSNCECPCWAFIREGEVRMDDIEVDGSWNID